MNKINNNIWFKKIKELDFKSKKEGERAVKLASFYTQDLELNLILGIEQLAEKYKESNFDDWLFFLEHPRIKIWIQKAGGFFDNLELRRIKNQIKTQLENSKNLSKEDIMVVRALTSLYTQLTQKVVKQLETIEGNQKNRQEFIYYDKPNDNDSWELTSENNNENSQSRYFVFEAINKQTKMSDGFIYNNKGLWLVSKFKASSLFCRTLDEYNKFYTNFNVKFINYELIKHNLEGPKNIVSGEVSIETSN